MLLEICTWAIALCCCRDVVINSLFSKENTCGCGGGGAPGMKIARRIPGRVCAFTTEVRLIRLFATCHFGWMLKQRSHCLPGLAVSLTNCMWAGRGKGQGGRGRGGGEGGGEGGKLRMYLRMTRGGPGRAALRLRAKSSCNSGVPSCSWLLGLTYSTTGCRIFLMISACTSIHR